MRLLPDSLLGRTLLFPAGMMILLILGGYLLLNDERRQRFDELSRRHLLDQVVTLVRLTQVADTVEREQLLQQAAPRGFEASMDERPLARGIPHRPPERMLLHRLMRRLSFLHRDGIGIRMVRKPGEDEPHNGPPERRFGRGGPPSFAPKFDHVLISIRLPDGLWLNMNTEAFGGPPPWAVRTLILFLSLLLLLTLAGVWIARRMTRPMAALATAADQVGRGEESPILPERGPREVRRTISAFNRMQERLQRQLCDRTLMLTAISHDLRTPITALRLRADYIEDAEMREKTLATLAEMEGILTVTLDFARDETAEERSRPVDLTSMLQSLCDDHAHLGGSCTFSGPERLIIDCRPTAMRRALGNLIENAIDYGGEAQVALRQERDAVIIWVEDSGPGIPEGKLEQVFTPFCRLEQSRGRDTGGIGLGLALARTLIHAHGGELSLENRPEGGLRAIVRLFNH